MNKRAFVVAIFALPLMASADTSERNSSKTAAQLAATLGESEGKPSRTPTLAVIQQHKSEPPAARSTNNQRVAKSQRLARSQRLAAEPTTNQEIEKLDKTEAKSSRSAYQPVGDGSKSVRSARVVRVRRAQVASFDPRALRNGTAATMQADEVARSWKSNLRWDVITVDSYATAKGRSETDAQKLAQRNADKVRAHLVRQGVPGEYVIAIGHGVASAPGAKVELSVTTCDDVSIACRKPAPAK